MGSIQHRGYLGEQGDECAMIALLSQPGQMRNMNKPLKENKSQKNHLTDLLASFNALFTDTLLINHIKEFLQGQLIPLMLPLFLFYLLKKM